MAAEADLDEVIDSSRLGRFQLLVIVLCALMVMIDGFDTQVIGMVAPSIATAWHVPPVAFGPVFGLGLFGGLIGVESMKHRLGVRASSGDAFALPRIQEQRLKGLGQEARRPDAVLAARSCTVFGKGTAGAGVAPKLMVRAYAPVPRAVLSAPATLM